MKEKFIDTIDNQKIAINHYENGKDICLVIVHGWFMTKDTKPFKSMADDFSNNYDVITMDCRGHGKSSGFYTFTAEELNDVDAVVSYAKESYKKVVLMGFSLGGALTVLYGAKYDKADVLIPISAPADFDKIENHMWKPEAFVPTFQKAEIEVNRNIRPGNIFKDKIKPIDVAEDITSPALFIAGENDPTVFPWHTKALHDKAKCKKAYKLFKDTNHAEDLYLDFREEFLNICNQFIGENL